MSMTEILEKKNNRDGAIKNSTLSTIMMEIIDDSFC